MINFVLRGLPTINLDWWAPTQRRWAPVLRRDQEVPWRAESDPTTGRPWQALSVKYERYKRKRYPGQPILRATGKMQDRAKIRPMGEGFDVKTEKYGRYHQFGTRKMPARPWVGIPDISLKKIVPIAWRNILSRPRR
jgi:phage virion morphogenesis protein